MKESGNEEMIVYKLLIEEVNSSAVKYLFEDLESESYALNVKIEGFNLSLLYDILLLIDFYNIDLSVLEKYKTAIENYQARTMKQHLDVIEVVDKINATNSGIRLRYPGINTFFLESLDALYEELTRKCPCDEYIPVKNLKIVAEMLSQNEDRLDVVASLFKKLKCRFE